MGEEDLHQAKEDQAQAQEDQARYPQVLQGRRQRKRREAQKVVPRDWLRGRLHGQELRQELLRSLRIDLRLPEVRPARERRGLECAGVNGEIKLVLSLF